MVIIKKPKMINTGEGVGKREIFYTVSENVNRCSYCAKHRVGHD